MPCRPQSSCQPPLFRGSYVSSRMEDVCRLGNHLRSSYEGGFGEKLLNLLNDLRQMGTVRRGKTKTPKVKFFPSSLIKLEGTNTPDAFTTVAELGRVGGGDSN